MFCSRCGTEVDKASQFCPACGNDVRLTTPVQAIATGDITELDIVREALGPEYELLEELGRGGMAIVYRARELALEREVAIKVLPFSLAFDAEFVERFQREARTAAQLEHPNIIPIYRVGRSGRVIFFVMKLLRGQSLARMIKDRGRLTPLEVRRVLVEAGAALGYAHSRGIVHRDVKPDNIMFDEFGQVVVTDFGIAKAANGQRLTGTGMSLGTPHYMSPEQARAQGIDGRSDVYSLGIVAYQALVGEVPYDGEDSFTIGYKHIMEPIPSPALATADERRVFEVIRRMIAKQPDERFQSADELIFALDAEPLSAGATGRPSGRASLAQPSVVMPPDIVPQPPGTVPARRSTQAPGATGTGRRRPVGRRSIVHSSPRSSALRWGIPLLIVLAGGAYLAFNPDTMKVARDAAANGAARVSGKPTSPPESTTALPAVHSDSESQVAPLPDSARLSSPPAPAPATTPTPVPAPAASADSGGLRISGLPAQTQVMIDERAMTDPDIRLPAGPHELAILAPRHEFYRDTIQIVAGKVLELTPDLIPMGGRPRAAAQAPVTCDSPAVANRFGRACYDTPPLPIGGSRVSLPDGFKGTPRQSILLVRVSADGKTERVLPFTPSNDSAFEQLAISFTQDVHWKPATKAGAPVEGWTQFVVAPQ